MDKNRNSELIAPVRFEPLSGSNTPARSITVRRKTIIISSSLLVCAAVAIFLFAAKAVYIETSPPIADVDIGSFLQLKLADRHLLLGGEHEMNISAEGYHDLEKVLTVGDEQNQHYTFTLAPLPGHLQVDTGSVSGAQVYIDEQAKGHTPALLRDIEPGEHQLRIVAERYLPVEETITIEGLDREQVYKTELVPAWAKVNFATEPAGADIFVDDELLGKTPYSAEIMQGKRKVRMKLAGYRLWQDEIRVVANQAMDLTGITLAPAEAVVFLASDPPRANSTVDGEYKGLTPLEVELTPGRKSTVRLFKQGYKPATRTITVKAGDEQRLVIKLEPELVRVDFNVTPKDARLLIDGEAQASANLSLELPARSHRIEIQKEGFVSYSTKISPHSGIPQQVNVSLKTERQAKLEKVKPVYTNSAGQTLKLFYPTAFTMGASRREPGRRANETLRKVEMKRPFYLGTHEVTNAQFRRFAAAHGSGSIQGNNLDGDTQPVANVAWAQAALYCNWLSKAESLTPFYTESGNKITAFNPAANGYRLPTEAEWAWAARVTGTDSLLKYAWGEDMPPPQRFGNYADLSTAGFLGKIIGNYQDGFMVSAPVGSFAANHRGLFDMSGNVAEWVNDFYDIRAAGGGRTELDPTGPSTGEFHVIRGSSWAHGTVTELRLSYRDYNAKTRDDVGFRIARYLE